MAETRTETDTFGPIEVDATRYWGAQSQRSIGNFKIGWEKQPKPIVRALGIVKRAAAEANMELGRLDGVADAERAKVRLLRQFDPANGAGAAQPALPASTMRTPGSAASRTTSPSSTLAPNRFRVPAPPKSFSNCSPQHHPGRPGAARASTIAPRRWTSRKCPMRISKND